MHRRRSSVVDSRGFALLIPIAALCLALGWGAGCGREEIQIYRIPKEPVGTSTLEPHTTAPAPPIEWQTPQNWEAQPASGMRLANFRITGESGGSAEASILSLPGGAGQEPTVVNIFREQLGLSPISPAALAALAKPVPIGAGEGVLYDLRSEGGAQTPGKRLLVAVLNRGGGAWYFNLRGPPAFVGDQEPAFRQLLKSVTWDTPEPGEPPVPAVGPATGTARSRPKWEVPDHWQEQAPGSMLVAKYTAAAEGGQSEITVSAFPGDVGGIPANVNRWRGQVGLSPVSDTDALASVGTLNLPLGTAQIAELTGERGGKPARLIGVIVPRADWTWFYKLLGDESAVAGEREAFLRFLETVRYPAAEESPE